MGGVATLVETAGALGAAFLQRPLNDAAALRHALDRRRRRPLPSPVAVVNPRVVPPVRVQPSAVAQGLRHGVRADALGEPRARRCRCDATTRRNCVRVRPTYRAHSHAQPCRATAARSHWPWPKKSTGFPRHDCCRCRDGFLEGVAGVAG